MQVDIIDMYILQSPAYKPSWFTHQLKTDTPDQFIVGYIFKNQMHRSLSDLRSIAMSRFMFMGFQLLTPPAMFLQRKLQIQRGSHMLKFWQWQTATTITRRPQRQCQE